MMNPGSNYMMMRMRQAIAKLEAEKAELEAIVADLKAAGAKAKPKKAFEDVEPKAKPVVKKLELDEETTPEKE